MPGGCGRCSTTRLRRQPETRRSPPTRPGSTPPTKPSDPPRSTRRIAFSTLTEPASTQRRSRDLSAPSGSPASGPSCGSLTGSASTSSAWYQAFTSPSPVAWLTCAARNRRSRPISYDARRSPMPVRSLRGGTTPGRSAAGCLRPAEDEGLRATGTRPSRGWRLAETRIEAWPGLGPAARLHHALEP